MSSEFKIVKLMSAMAVALALCVGISAQTGANSTGDSPATAIKTDPTVGQKSSSTTDGKAAGEADSPEADAILPYYNNYLKEYRLGPNDVITIEVFGQCPDYCKTGITVPPTARISYPLIRDGVMVGGKTVEQVAAEVTKYLDEYIIDPKVTVTLDKAMSARYSVLGKVNSPGVRVLDRKVSVYEAVVESGGVAKDGNLKKVFVYSYNGQGKITSRLINLEELQRGRGQMVFLNPGDQVFVSGKGFSLEKVFDIISKASVIRFLMGSPF
jgi:protein involved in polysaccharide export with SLBB domain